MRLLISCKHVWRSQIPGYTTTSTNSLMCIRCGVPGVKKIVENKDSTEDTS